MKKILTLAFILLFGIAAQAQKWQIVQIKTSAICSKCKDHIETALAYEKGVKKSNLDVKSKMITVKYNPSKTNPDKIRKAIAKSGYDADNVPADPKSYEKLEDCCKKDGKNEEEK